MQRTFRHMVTQPHNSTLKDRKCPRLQIYSCALTIGPIFCFARIKPIFPSYCTSFLCAKETANWEFVLYLLYCIFWIGLVIVSKFGFQRQELFEYFIFLELISINQTLDSQVLYFLKLCYLYKFNYVNNFYSQQFLIQVNEYETDMYFLPNFQCRTMLIHAFCKICEPRIVLQE